MVRGGLCKDPVRQTERFCWSSPSPQEPNGQTKAVSSLPTLRASLGCARVACPFLCNAPVVLTQDLLQGSGTWAHRGHPGPRRDLAIRSAAGRP